MAPRPTDPWRALLDVMVYAPVGLMSLARDEIPKLADQGRERVEHQLRLAHMVGRFAVAHGRKLLDQRLAAMTAEAATTPPPRPEAERRATVETTAREVDADTSESSVAVGDLPIAGYDELAASQVVGCLAGLSSAQLELVAAYERAHRARRTVLAKIAQLAGT